MRVVSILCAARNSVYKEMDYVDVYDIDRDCRTFSGGNPVVCHPPCRAWSAFCSHQAKPIEGEKELALLCVEWLRKCGGVLEHPAYSRLWLALGLPLPGSRKTGDLFTEWVNQSWFGDTRTKGTWLLFSRVERSEIDIPFRLHSSVGDRFRWQRMSKNQRASTPKQFAEWLVDIARNAY